jgi:hypothetical protein
MKTQTLSIITKDITKVLALLIVISLSLTVSMSACTTQKVFGYSERSKKGQVVKNRAMRRNPDLDLAKWQCAPKHRVR